MKIDKELEIDFIRIIQKRSCDRTRLEESRIRKRNHLIESQFELTQEVNEKIILLNEKLRHEEKRIFVAYRQLEKQCMLMVANKTIEDYNITVELSFWNKKHYKKYEPSVYGNPFFEHSHSFMLFQEHESEYNPKQFNEHQSNSPFPEIDQCFSFTYLIYSCHELTWFYIYNIDEVWMEIKVDYQFFTKIQ